jgi:hypothetical protein
MEEAAVCVMEEEAVCVMEEEAEEEVVCVCV